MLHVLTSNIRVIVHRWARRPFETGGFLSLIMLIAAAGPWACIAHCTSGAGAKHMQHHGPRHIISTGAGNVSTDAGNVVAAGEAGGARVLAHRDHNPVAHHSAAVTGGDIVAVSVGHEGADMSMRAQPAGIPETGNAGTIHALHCPPGPTMTALTVAIMLPAAPALSIAVRRLPVSSPLSCYTSIDSRPPGPPPRASQRLAI